MDGVPDGVRSLFLREVERFQDSLVRGGVEILDEFGDKLLPLPPLREFRAVKMVVRGRATDKTPEASTARS